MWNCSLVEANSTDELELNIFESCNSSFIPNLLLARVGAFLQWSMYTYGLEMQREAIKIR